MPNTIPFNSRWQFYIDRGGTFTDVIGRDPQGELHVAKLLSENPEQYPDAAVQGIRQLLGLEAHQAITPERVAVVKMGTTVATNALLERKGEPTALAITTGFKDSLRIAYQNRPKLFEREIILPELLYQHVSTIDERLDAAGDVVTALDLSQARVSLQSGYDKGIRSLAIVLMHAYRNGAHELALAAIAKEIGFSQISVSHQVSPMIKLVARGDTTVVDAYLSPVLRRYVDQVAKAMPGVNLQFMQSNGGLTAAQVFQGKDSILSGPAGGIVGMATVSQRAGFEKVIGFDMGGTSTDVSHFAGEYERAFDTMVAGVRLRAPMMSIHTVAAGGGSVLHFDGQRLRVGPDSAGANPGPACYRRGGPLAVTDANVMLGRLQPAWFPKVFGASGDQALDAQVVRERFQALALEVSKATGVPKNAEEIAQGFLDIAVQNMANAIKKISVQRGYDVTQYALTVFGGAGGQHACAVADALGMATVLAHPLGGVLSAYGMGLAPQNLMREKSLEKPLDDSGLALAQSELTALAQSAGQQLLAQSASSMDATLAKKALVLIKRLHLRYEGTDTSLTVVQADMAQMRAAFEQQYLQRFAFLLEGRKLVIEAVSVEAILPTDVQDAQLLDGKPRSGPLEPLATAQVYARGWHEAALFDRAYMQEEDIVNGPAVIIEASATTLVEPGWQARMTGARDLVLTRVQARPRSLALGTQADPVMLEVFNNLFMSIAEQMGYRLQNTAHSVNIKERLDFSCALFDAKGHLIANAPHMPVHLGSMGASIEAVIRDNAGSMQAGDVYVLNDPYRGGTHLPDVTVVTPVFDEAGRDILFYVGSRGHHADIGGLSPGSMPPDSRTIEEEGVLISNFKLIEAGRMREAQFRELLTSAKYPTRNVEQNLADLRAQVAANEKGREEITAMVRHFGLEVVNAYMNHVQDNAMACVQRVIGALKDGRFEVDLDNGAKIAVSITVDRTARQATIDFTGTSSQRENNFNAPTAVTFAAVLYVFRTLVDDDIPMNAGCLRPLKIVIPEGSMLNPTYPAAVVAGNVETSTCITNCLYGALGVMASSQPTVNNFTFGNAKYQYYETISGGSGAGGRFNETGELIGGFHGTSLVQTHMTNSRLTDPEVLELRFPVRLEDYALRAGSGGAGKWHGGDGGVRRIRFLEPMTASILANGRVRRGFGAAGGKPGAAGNNWVVRNDGRIEPLGHADQAQLQAGEQFVIETPGGGGFGVA
jgi:5-oxoprolinase (ATP-hydrolysing)